MARTNNSARKRKSTEGHSPKSLSSLGDEKKVACKEERKEVTRNERKERVAREKKKKEIEEFWTKGIWKNDVWLNEERLEQQNIERKNNVWLNEKHLEQNAESLRQQSIMTKEEPISNTYDGSEANLLKTQNLKAIREASVDRQRVPSYPEPLIVTTDQMIMMAWNADILRNCQASFLRHRKPSPERIRALVKRLAPTALPCEYITLCQNARECFEEMREQYIRVVRNLALIARKQFMQGENQQNPPTIQKIFVEFIRREHVDEAFRYTLSVIDHRYLRSTLPYSKFITAECFMMNFVAMSVALFIDESLLKIKTDEALAYIYKIDRETDGDQWILPFKSLIDR